jgi:hypothetical protein
VSILILFLISFRNVEGGIVVPIGLLYPKIPPSLPVYRLQPQKDLASRVDQALGPRPDGQKVKQLSPGEVSIFLPDAPDNAPLANENTSPTAKAFFDRVLPAEEITGFVAGAVIKMAHQRVLRDQPAGDIVEDASIVRMDRAIGEYRVFGTGSAAVAEIRNGRVAGVVIRWDAPQPVGLVSTSQIDHDFLRARLSDIFNAMDADVLVTQSPEVAYYDDRQTLSPVYRVLVEIHRGKNIPVDDLVVYIPAVSGVGPPPFLTEGQISTCQASDLTGAAGSLGVLIDRYALLADQGMWVLSAREFGASVATNGSLTPQLFCYVAATQFGTEKGRFINSANIALVESHGIPREIYVDLLNDQRFALEKGGGYGIDTGGALRLLILHSCEVIEAADDCDTWYDPWWTIFAGLQTAVGFRTKMLIPDHVPAAYGRHLAADDDLIRSWLAEVVAVRDYGLGTMTDATGGPKPLGRAAAVSVCSAALRTTTQLSDVSSPDCLVNYWLRN